MYGLFSLNPSNLDRNDLPGNKVGGTLSLHGTFSGITDKLGKNKTGAGGPTPSNVVVLDVGMELTLLSLVESVKAN